MKFVFPKDLLLIDFESTLGDSEKSEPAQFGAILLDKATLEEKKSFVSFIKTDLSIIPKEELIKKGFPPEKFANAPTASEIAKRFIREFGKDYFISSWVANLDLRLFRKLISSAKISYSEFDYHTYDLFAGTRLQRFLEIRRDVSRVRVSPTRSTRCIRRLPSCCTSIKKNLGEIINRD